MSEFDSKEDFEISIKEAVMRLDEFQTLYDNINDDDGQKQFMEEFNLLSSRWQGIYENIRDGLEDPAIQKELLEKLKNAKRKS